MVKTEYIVLVFLNFFYLKALSLCKLDLRLKCA